MAASTLPSPPRHLRVRGEAGSERTTNVELFFDLVYVFAITQLSHLLIGEPSLAGIGHAAFLLIVVWWAWIYTTWMANWFDPSSAKVRTVLTGVMLASLLMAASVPDAFGDQGLLFAASYVLLQVGRNAAAMTLVGRDHRLRGVFERLVAWSVLSGVLWLAGAALDGDQRLILWIPALALELIAPFAGYWMPGRGRGATTDWDIEGGHFAERCQLFIIIALGESIVITGATASDFGLSPVVVACLVVAFLETVALWWLYFGEPGERSRMAVTASDDPGRVARNAYTYLHVLIVAGIIATAAGDELLIAHPHDPQSAIGIALILGGPALFLLGEILFQLSTTGTTNMRRLVTAVLIVALAPLGAQISSLALAIIVTALLTAVAIWELRAATPGVWDAKAKGGVGVIAGQHCLAPARTVDGPIDGTAGRYSRLFPNLPPIDEDNEALLALSVAGGVCDGGDDCADATDTAAGWPMFGQYIAHDITADRSPIGPQAQLSRIVNFRSPRANLESLYAAGQIGSPFLFRADDPDLLLLGTNDRGEDRDLPRNSQGVALIGDPRNDVHLFVSQMQVAMIGVHNRLVERAREDGVRPSEVFAAARRGTWHYEWVILNDYLPRLVDPELAAEVLDGGARFYAPGDDPKIPFEFADAAFRYGHGQVRDDFEVNGESGVRRFFPDLLGFRPVPAELAVDWSLLFDIEGHSPAQRAKLIDGTLARSLLELPAAVTGEVEVEAYRSLAGRDLERGHAYGLPSGEAVAEAMGEIPLSPDENPLAGSDWTAGTPLWLYFMFESTARGDGERLGPAGGRIVAEVLTGLIDADPESYRSVEPDWTPTLPAREERFGLTDLLVLA